MVKKMMETMAKPNTILEKKLEELECSLEEFGLKGSGDVDPNTYREIEHRFIFIKTLLSAEIMYSVNNDEEDEELLKLARMARKFTQLEEAFSHKELTGPINEPVIPALESDGVVVDETGSGSIEPLQENFQDSSMDKNKMLGRETDQMIKKNRFRSLVGCMVVGLIAFMVGYFACLFHQMANSHTLV
ncbi:unnamed protein product [Cochlearia groenlandica]